MGKIYVLDTKISLNRLKEIASERFGDMVKGVVDIEKHMIALGSELHADAEALLLEQGSEQQNLWGFNLYPNNEGEGFIEFDSMINIRPSQNNWTRTIQDPEIRKRILDVVNQWIER